MIMTVVAQIQFSLMKQIKTGRPEHSLPHTPYVQERLGG